MLLVVGAAELVGASAVLVAASAVEEEEGAETGAFDSTGGELVELSIEVSAELSAVLGPVYIDAFCSVEVLMAAEALVCSLVAALEDSGAATETEELLPPGVMVTVTTLVEVSVTVSPSVAQEESLTASLLAATGEIVARSVEVAVLE